MRRRARRAPARAALTALLAVGLSGALSASAPAQGSEATRADSGRIIVQRAPGLDTAERAEIRAAADVELVTRLRLTDTEVVRAAPGELDQALAALNRDDGVVYAVPDAIVEGTADPHADQLWPLENSGQLASQPDSALRLRQFGTSAVRDADIDAPEAWQRSVGAGQSIAVVDSGVDFSHPDLQGRIDASRARDWVDGDAVPTDGNGHGTHVTGTIVANRDNDIGVSGVAPAATVLPLRALDDANKGFTSWVVSAFDYAGDLRYRVVTASLGGTDAQALLPIRAAIEEHPDTLFVLAAGNAGTDNDVQPFYPCSLQLENIICVGATDAADRPATFSNRGRLSVDLHAPGVDVFSGFKQGYGYLSGTSMATPHVSAVAALVAATDATLSPLAIKQRILDSVDPKPELVGESVTGGRLNAAKAVGAAATPVPTPTPAPEPTATPAPTPVAPAPVATPTVAPAPAVSAPVQPRTETSSPQPRLGEFTGPVTNVAAPDPTPTTAPTAPRSAVTGAPATDTSPAPSLPTSAGAGKAAARAPAVSGLKLTGRVLRSSLALRFRLARGARTDIAIAVKRCHRGRCAYTTVRRTTLQGRTGSNVFALRRADRGRRLARGTYRVTVRVAGSAATDRGQTANFTVR